MKRFDEAIAGFEKAIALRPDYPEAYQNLGITLQDEKRIEEAIAAYRKAIALRPNYAEAYSNLGFCELQLGQFEAGFRDYEARKLQAGLPDTRFITRPEWRGENIEGKTLFVHCEQGFGDTLQFCRFGKVAAARGIKVIMSVQQPLWKLLQQLRPPVNVIAQDTVPAAFDYHCSLMSLPGPLGINAGTIPVEQRYLASDPALSRVLAERLPQPSSKPRIGVTWSGNPKHKNELNRSMPLKVLSPLFAAGAHWVSLQKERRPDDAGLLAELPVAPLADTLDRFRRYRGADRQPRSGHHRRHQCRASCRRNGQAGMDPAAVLSGLALVPRRRDQPVVSVCKAVPPGSQPFVGERHCTRS